MIGRDPSILQQFWESFPAQTCVQLCQCRRWHVDQVSCASCVMTDVKVVISIPGTLLDTIAQKAHGILWPLTPSQS